MYSASGFFYAYAKRSDHDSLERYMIVFVNRATADEWWRAITDSVTAGYNKFEAMKRIAPHFYTYNYHVNGGHITYTLTDNRVAAKLLGRVFLIPLNDRDPRELCMFPALNYVDHISGNGFFVRSSLQRDQYWFFDGQKIVASRDYRTRFTIELVSSSQTDPQGSKGQVMIGTDLVSTSVSNCNGLVNIQPDLSLSISQGAEPLVILFSQFDGGFEIGINGVLLSNQQGAGDRWELASIWILLRFTSSFVLVTMVVQVLNSQLAMPVMAGLR